MAEAATVAQRIRIYRRRRGLSQVRLAIAVGRSESWLSQVERGERSVDRLSVLLKVAEVASELCCKSERRSRVLLSF